MVVMQDQIPVALEAAEGLVLLEEMVVVVMTAEMVAQERRLLYPARP